MGRMYSATFEEVAVSVVQDLFRVSAPSDAIVVVHRVTISQSSDAGDSESEQLSVLIHRGTTDGSAGSTPVARPMELGTVAFGGTVGANNTTQSTEGVFIHAEAFNVMAGLDIVWTPETRPVITPSARLVVELQTAPGDELTMSGTIYFEEIGG